MIFVEFCWLVQVYIVLYWCVCLFQCGGVLEVGVGGLQGFDMFGVGLDYEIGVGLQVCDVVEVVYYNFVFFLLFEKCGCVVDDCVMLVIECIGIY